MNKYIQMDTKFVAGAILMVFIIAGILLHMEIAGVSAQKYVERAKKNMLSDSYDLTKAKTFYEKALEKDSTNQDALFDLARISYITGEYEKAFEYIDTYTQVYPSEKRIHYIAGLTNAYAGDFSEAENEFQTFIKSGLARWPTYLDLAWVYFEQDKLTSAKETLLSAIGTFGDNAWLNTSLGAVLIAQGNTDEAKVRLEKAQEQARLITKEDWRQNYSFNNPDEIESEIRQMQDVIKFNLSIIDGDPDVTLAAQALGTGFTGISPKGYKHGIVVSACGDSYSQGGYYSQSSYCVSNQGDTCFVTNSCGNTSSGTVTCGGSCTADPPGSCSAFNPSISAGSCVVSELYAINITAIDPDGDNVRYGIDWNNDGAVDQYAPTDGYVSSGSTQTVGNVFSTEGVKTLRVQAEDEGGAASEFVSHTFVCSEGDGNALLGGGDDEGEGGGGINGALVAQPLIVHSGDSTTLIWATEGVDSCTVTGTNGDVFTDTSRTTSSGPITEQTLFTLNCDSGVIVDSVIVNVVPVFQEI